MMGGARGPGLGARNSGRGALAPGPGPRTLDPELRTPDPRPPPPNTWGVVGLVLVVALALLVPGLGRAPFDDPGEGMHAEIAREVLLTNDWITLHLNGVRYFDKPPLLYWLPAW